MQSLSELFEASNGHDLDLTNLDQTEPIDPESVAYVSRMARQNGVLAFVKRLEGIEPAPAGTLSMALGGSYAAATFLQPREYYTAQNVRVLAPKRPMSDSEKLWWALCITHNRFRFGYGRHANRTFRQIQLPDTVPSWVARTRWPDVAGLATSAASDRPSPMSPTTWEWVALDSIFEIMRGRYVPAARKGVGRTPEVSSSAASNGVSRYIDLPPEHPAGVISVARNGSVGYAFVQPKPFFATDDVHVFYPRGELPPEALLFICVLIRKERYRFSYGRKWSLEGMRRAEIRLPTTPRGDHDWAWIAAFIRSLPFSGSVGLEGQSETNGCSSESR